MSLLLGMEICPEICLSASFEINKIGDDIIPA